MNSSTRLYKEIKMNYSTMTAGEVRKATGVSRAQLRYWEDHRIIAPMREAHASRTWRTYPKAEIERIIALKTLLDDGYTLRGAARRLGGSAVTAAGPAAVLVG